MSLRTIINGNAPGNDIDASWWNDYKDLLTGVMDDTPVTLAYSSSGGTTLTIVDGSSTGSALDIMVGGDADSWLRFYHNHTIGMGDGSSLPDVFFSRTAPGEMTWEGNIVVTGTLKSGNTGDFSYNKMSVTGKNIADAFELPWFDTNINCPVVYLDGQSGSPGQITFGGRAGGSSGQKDILFANATSGWYIFQSNGGQFHVGDSNTPTSDPFVVQASGVFSHNIQWSHSDGYGSGPVKFCGSFGGGHATVAHSFGRTPTFGNVIPFFNNSSATGSYPVAISNWDSNNVYVNVGGTTNTNVWVG